MSTKRKNAPRTNLPGRSPETPPAPSLSASAPTESAANPSNPPQRPEMAANGREIEISELTFRQQSALPAVAVSRTLAEAARDSGVAERTLRRWLQDPSYRDQLDRLRAESYDLARSQLQAAVPQLISIVAEIAVEAQDPALRLRAARYLVTHGAKLNEFDRLHSRLQDLEDSVRHAPGAASPA